MLNPVTCSNCGTVNHLNPEKHASQRKLCRKCRTVVADPSKPFTLFTAVKIFIARLPIIKEEIAKAKKKKGMRARAITYERTLILQEEAARRTMKKMLKDFPHLQRWAE